MDKIGRYLDYLNFFHPSNFFAVLTAPKRDEHFSDLLISKDGLKMSTKSEIEYVYALDKMDRQIVNEDLSTSKGASVSGERISVGLVHKTRGTGSRSHSHASEQFNFVLQGTLQAEIGGKTYLVPKGSVVHIPANVVHSIIATPEEDAIFFVCKDTHGSLGDGVASDRNSRGPRYDPGIEPKISPASSRASKK